MAVDRDATRRAIFVLLVLTLGAATMLWASHSAGSPLEGTWRPLFSGSGIPPSAIDEPYVRFSDDGQWSASDGCNGTVGRFRVEDNGARFRARSTGATTLIGCLNVPNADVLRDSRSVEIGARRLTFRDASGSVTGSYARVGPG